MSGAEVLRIHTRIPGVAEAGDIIVYDPAHPNEALRLCRLVPLEPELLPIIRAHISGYPSGDLDPDGRVPEGFLGLKLLE